MLCRKLQLFSEAFVAIDGSKFKAVNNRDRNFTKAKLKRRLQQIDESVERYLAEIASADRQERAVSGDKSQRLKGQDRGTEGRDRPPKKARGAARGDAGPSGLTDGPGRALDGDERPWQRHGGVQRADGGRHEESSDCGT